MAELRRRERELSDFAAELHKSRRQLAAVFNNATVALFIMDERQHCTYMNRAAEKLTGYVLDEVQGRPLHYFIHHTRPDGRPYPLEECPIDQAFPQNNQEQGEEVFVHKDGSFYPVAFTASPIREGETTVGTIIEVRDIRRERQAAQEREELLEREQSARAEAERQRDFSRRVLDHAPIAIGVMEGPEHRFVLVNSRTCMLTGLSEAEFIGRTHTEVLPEADKVVGPILDRVYASGVGETEEIEVELPKGRRQLLVAWTALPGAAGRAGAVLYMSLDITERKRAETALRESQARLRMAMDVANIYSWEMNLATRRLEWSANVERVLGFSLPTDFETLLPLVHEADRETTARLIAEAIETGGVYESEFRLVNPTSGEILWVVGQGVLALGFDDEQPRFVGITQNITNRKRAAEAL
ncbi:MAG TPA: PAS domain S-box protein, partial [Pyrinomonadaceae bacterium]|nr:PAS domain S-box protein [Pyrinomonadaceae bacterium]